jgi:hypothetical protein
MSEGRTDKRSRSGGRRALCRNAILATTAFAHCPKLPKSRARSSDASLAFLAEHSPTASCQLGIEREFPWDSTSRIHGRCIEHSFGTLALKRRRAAKESILNEQNSNSSRHPARQEIRGNCDLLDASLKVSRSGTPVVKADIDVHVPANLA